MSMFDRAKERELLTNLLCNKYPELLVITGPWDTGKTRLIENVKKLTEAQNRLWWTHVNMRDPLHHWTNVEAAYRSLLQTFTTDFSRRTKAAAMSFLRTLQLNIPLSEGASPSSISWRLPENCRP
ncbi:MAG: hypothetical protein MJE68_02665, partial [Proteobacteria bacterium]|nr:hypothetical protein [Pseudomonadota bacterium]